MAKEQKRKKIEDILKNAKPVVIDYEKIAADLKRDQEEWDKKYEAEQKRQEELPCPVCKSKEKKRGYVASDNGVYGPGYHSHVHLSYITCQSCGVMYQDVNPVDIGKRPTSIWGIR